eukprot:4328303-Alexandrium_andersonii.AAC.1
MQLQSKHRTAPAHLRHSSSNVVHLHSSRIAPAHVQQSSTALQHCSQAAATQFQGSPAQLAKQLKDSSTTV